MNQKNNKKTRNKLQRFITILTVFVMLCCCMGCGKKTPREQLEAAYEKTFFEANPAESLLGLKEITSKQSDNGAYSSGLSLTLQELSGEGLDEYSGLLSGLGFTVDSASDTANKKQACTIDINYGGATYLTIGEQLVDSKLSLMVPQLLDGSLSIDFSTLKDDLASDSMLAKAFRESGVTLPDNFNEEFLQSLNSVTSLADLAKITATLKEFSDGLVIEVIDKKDVAFPEDVKAKSAFTVTVTKDNYKKLINAFLQYVLDYSNTMLESMGETAEEVDMTEVNASIDELAETVGDIVITVAVNKSGYITYATSEITSETETFTLTANFNGEKKPLTDYEIVFDANIDGETLSFTLEELFDEETKEASFSAKATANAEQIFSLSGETAYTDIEKGKKYTIDLNFLEFNIADTLSVSLAGSYYIDTTKCDITAPTGTEYSLFAMTDTEFTAVLLQVLTKLQSDPLFSGLLEYIDFGL